MMNSIESFFKMFNPKITVKYLKTTPKTENGTIEHEFVHFEIENADIDNIFEAKMLAKRMGQKVFPLLDKLAENTQNEAKLNNIINTRAWVYKKAVWHPALVEKCAHKVLHKMKKSGSLNDIPLTYKEIYTDISIAAILHDIGRLSEVDIMQGMVVPKGYGLKNHATIGFDILQYAKIKPEILLAIKYHYFAGIKEAINDDIYKKLKPENQKIAEFYVRILQDMDKAGNLAERSKLGIKKSSEYFSPEYVKDYNFSTEAYETAMSGKYLAAEKGHHLIEAMVHYVTMGYEAHYRETKELMASVLSDLFLRIYEEIWEEYNNSDDKNIKRLVDTLEKTIKLEDYAVFERNGMEINERHRNKVLRQIAGLKIKSGN